ncbi:HdeD family acid-resistance protein [Herbaspirillum sp. alder98]|uniref:HdeD family acid-resistance protein n=1 Tax=Herbaspirillum sp. alder98 TaxID=2913096 RepID=UPI001CD8FD73|nr:MFS transporter [Herbaspirillum sp. alder98]MCA1323068.1 MFS transporter [Herbaspirillum sp. alder98]
MIRLVLLLLGADFIRRNWHVLATAGVVWGAIGVSLMIDALDGVLNFPLQLFGYLLLVESLVTLVVANSGIGAQKTLRYVKGGLFLLISILIISPHHASGMVLAMLFGAAFAIGGGLQITSAALVRFPRWRMAVAGGGVQILLAIVFFQPYPTHYKGTVPFCLALGLIFGGWNMIWLALRSRMLPQRVSVDMLDEHNEGDDRPFDAGLYRGDEAKPSLRMGGKGQGPAAAASAPLNAAAAASAVPPSQPEIIDDQALEGGLPPLTVHVWTPTGSAKGPARRQPVVDRYIAAVDTNGVISTGHAALEIQPDLYISLYPAQEIDRSPDQFARLLRATAENDVGGRYLTDYRSEAAAWCESTEKIVFRDYHRAHLDRFWAGYRKREVYNLTYRNCSSTVARGLEAALEGVIGRRDRHWFNAVRMMLTPEIWVASQIRKRALTMAWTPGLVLDYARALRAVVHPRPLSWSASLQLAIRQSRRLREVWRARRRYAERGAAQDN